MITLIPFSFKKVTEYLDYFDTFKTEEY